MHVPIFTPEEYAAAEVIVERGFAAIWDQIDTAGERPGETFRDRLYALARSDQAFGIAFEAKCFADAARVSTNAWVWDGSRRVPEFSDA